MPDDASIDVGLLVYFLAPLVAIFIGPLEAIAGVVGYWLLSSDDEPETASREPTKR